MGMWVCLGVCRIVCTFMCVCVCVCVLSEHSRSAIRTPLLVSVLEFKHWFFMCFHDISPFPPSPTASSFTLTQINQTGC